MRPAYIWIKDGSWVYGQIAAEITGVGYHIGTDLQYQITYHFGNEVKNTGYFSLENPIHDFEIMDEEILKKKIEDGALLDSRSEEIMHRYWAMT